MIYETKNIFYGIFIIYSWPIHGPYMALTFIFLSLNVLLLLFFRSSILFHKYINIVMSRNILMAHICDTFIFLTLVFFLNFNYNVCIM